MKTKTTWATKFKAFGRGATIFAIALVAMMTVTGCGKKKSGSRNTGTVIVGGNYGCPQCVSGSGTFIKSGLGFSRSAMAGSQPRFELALEFYGNAYDGSYYGGPVFAYGTLRVNFMDALNTCVPAGIYTLQPYQGQPGQLANNNQSFATVLQGSGPTQVIIELPNNYFMNSPTPMRGSDGRTYPYSMWNPMRITAATCGNTVGSFQLTD